jgi:hypothetical protein
MHLVYIDDSKDEQSCCFSAIVISEDDWQPALDYLVAYRKRLKAEHGIYVSVEMHATDWLGGRGNIAATTIRRDVRAMLFRETLKAIVGIPNCSILNAHGPRRAQDQLFERLCNRINVNMTKRRSRAILISDEGKSFDSLVRRMRRHNPIPGHFGGVLQKPLDRIVEDPVYRHSDRSYFIQAADFCAFSLLRMESPTPAIIRHGLQDAFLDLGPALERRAFAQDPRKLGIIRVN